MFNELLDCAVAVETVGERLRRLRQERALTQEQLAAHATVTMQTVHRIESGKVGMSARTRDLIANALDVSPVYLETGEELRLSDVPDLPAAIASIYASLDEYARRAALENLRTLRDLQSAYRTEEKPEPTRGKPARDFELPKGSAAFSDPALSEAAYEDAEGWVEPPAEEAGEDEQ